MHVCVCLFEHIIWFSVSTALKRATSPKQVILPKEYPMAFEVLSGYTFGWDTCLQLDTL